MVARDGTGPKVPRSVSSCTDCLAWGRAYAQGVCLACYNFAAARFGQHPGRCAGCRRHVRLKRGYCRLCWCQARENRAVTAHDARSRVVLAEFVADVTCHQLFLADLYRPRARPRSAPRRRGAKGRPLKAPPPVAVRPHPDGAQLPLPLDLARTFRPATIDLRAAPAPDNPWLAWALHLAHTAAEARGFAPEVRRALNRNLVMLLATHIDDDQVRTSDFHRVIRNHGGALIHVIDVLAVMGVLHDDRPDVFDTWLAAKIEPLTPGIAEQTRRWANVLRHGGPRRRARHPGTAIGYLNAVRPALLPWSSTHDHLREVTRDDVIDFLDSVAPIPRMGALTALRSLFAWATRERVIFRNPARDPWHGPSRPDPPAPVRRRHLPRRRRRTHPAGTALRHPGRGARRPHRPDPRAAPRRRRSRERASHHRRHTAPARRPHPPGAARLAPPPSQPMAQHRQPAHADQPEHRAAPRPGQRQLHPRPARTADQPGTAPDRPPARRSPRPGR